MDFPIVFISYSWDNICHKEWVKKLADKLVADGFPFFLILMICVQVKI